MKRKADAFFSIYTENGVTMARKRRFFPLVFACLWLVECGKIIVRRVIRGVLCETITWNYLFDSLKFWWQRQGKKQISLYFKTKRRSVKEYFFHTCNSAVVIRAFRWPRLRWMQQSNLVLGVTLLPFLPPSPGEGRKRDPGNEIDSKGKGLGKRTTDLFI